MKSKATNIALVIALICIWGTVIYKFIGGSSNEDAYYLPQSNSSAFVEQIQLVQENFVVDGNYRDPFLGRTYHAPRAKSTTKKKSPKPVIPQIIKPPPDWSFLVYRGDFINEKKQHVGIITIRNKDVLAKEGEEKEGVKILKILKDSIQVNYQNEKKYIHKAKK